MVFENFVQQIASCVFLVFEQPSPEVGERLRADIVVERFLAKGVPDTEIEDVGVFEFFVREVLQVFDDLQRDEFIDWLVRTTIPIVVEYFEFLLINLSEHKIVKVRRPMIL